MNTLLVAPGSDLVYQTDEITAILRDDNLSVIPLTGNVTVRTLVAALRRPYDVIWFAVHCTERGLSLSDGLITGSELGPLLRGCKLLILNACQSLHVASAIHSLLGCDVVATVREIDDRAAFLFGVALLRNLAIFDTPRKAFDASIGASNSDYVYLRGDTMTSPGDDFSRTLHKLELEIALLRQRVEAQEKVLYKLEIAIEKAAHDRPEFNETTLRVVSATIIILCLLIAYGVYRIPL